MAQHLACACSMSARAPKAGVLCPNCIGPEAGVQAGADWLNSDAVAPPAAPKLALAPPNAALDAPKPPLDEPNAAPLAPSAALLEPPKGDAKGGAEPGCTPNPLADPPVTPAPLAGG